MFRLPCRYFENGSFSFLYVKFWKDVSVDVHASLHKSRRENHRWVVFTQQDMIYSRAHLVLTNLLITSLLVLCFSQWFLLFLPPKFLLISCRPIDSYSDICYFGTDELIIFVSFLWMIWVDLPFLIISFWKGISVDMHASLHKSKRENHRRVVFTQQDTIYSRAHLVLTNLLITSLFVLCFSQWFLLFLPPKFLWVFVVL